MTSHALLSRQLVIVTWSDKQQTAAAATVPATRFDEQFGFSVGSVHATLVHMLGRQQVWLHRLRHHDETAIPTVDDLPTLDAIRDRWRVIHDDWRAYLDGQTEAGLDATFEYVRSGRRYASPVRVIVANVLDHATHHRGQLNSLITLAGGTAVDCGQLQWSRLHAESSALL
jgi:uncharacterized damage-inducible protein DinB